MSENKVLVFNQEKCTGCRSCMMGCSLYHDGVCGKVASRVAVVRNEVVGESFVVGCDLCSDAPCAAVCPTGACSMDPQAGIAKINAAKCIGCKECAMACPFGAINMSVKTGKAFKCDLCEGRVRRPGMRRLVPQRRHHLYNAYHCVQGQAQGEANRSA